MDFYNFINRYELLCKRKYYRTYKSKQEINRYINSINEEINRMKLPFKKPLPIALTAGLAGGTMFGALFTMMFNAPFSIIYVLLFVLTTIIGIVNESYQKEWDRKMQELYSDLKDTYRLKTEKEKVESRLKSLMNDIQQCYDYYFYMVKEGDKTKPVTIDFKTVYQSQCRLSTFLHEYYSGNMDEFLSLMPHQQFREELNLRLSNQIREAKAEKLGYPEPIERKYRRPNRTLEKHL